MSQSVTSSPSVAQSVAFKTTHAFLLAPPPPPRFKRKPKVEPPSPPHSRNHSRTVTEHASPRQRRATVSATPRTPLTPLESFLNILDTPSPAVKSSTNHTNYAPITPDTALTTPGTSSFYNSGLHLGLGYSVAIESFYTSSIDSPKAPSRAPKSRSKSISAIPAVTVKLMAIGSLTNMNILSRTQQAPSKPPTSGPAKTPLMQRSNILSRTTSRANAPAAVPKPERRGSVPTIPTQNYDPRHHPHSSNSRKDQKAKEQKKRYPLPLPYSAVVEMDQILGDTRSASGVNPYMSAPRGASGNQRGGTGNGPLPYIGADGRMWRDREEELEYAALLKADEMRRRGSASSEEEELEKGRWKMFGNKAQTFKVTEQQLRTPSSATSSSMSSYYDDVGYSPIVQHQFPEYVFPSHAPIPLPVSVHDFAVQPTHAYLTASSAAPRERPRPTPLDLSSVNPSYIPPPPAAPTQTAPSYQRAAPAPAPAVVHPARAKDDFLASSFAPAPASPLRERSKPPTTGLSAVRSSRRSSSSAIVPSHFHSQSHSIPHSRPQVSGVHLAPPSQPVSRSASPALSGAGVRAVKTKASGGFLSSVFKKSGGKS